MTIKKISGNITTPLGFKATGLHSGVKKERKDLGLIISEQPASAAAVYTLNAIKAAPLRLTKENIGETGRVQAIIANSGNANACTGPQGDADALTMQEATASLLNIQSNLVAVASTGVIGQPMPMDIIKPAIEKLVPEKDGAEEFSEAILTTDTFAKTTCYEAEIAEKKVTLAGTAKGSGMIKPNMATMLGFLTTDAEIEPQYLQQALSEATDTTFNCITVDGDTSTNDMVIVMANGLARNDSLTPDHPDWPTFTKLIQSACEDLAKLIARDGEGATKLIEVDVQGAISDTEAVQVAKSVVGSSLVKTAVYGTDANWGRIIAAIGYSGASVNPDTIDTSIGHIQMLKDSQPLDFSEEEATAYMEQDTVLITIDLKNGEGSGKAWGCDLTYDYVRINASYRS
ncbi:bifunctional ornithine acetyltransferase/N-acetylglutamate synthase [Aciduricibacillus chroicocephali]|uniref:Arginine biosynthesis bifunctional protein ArgJ n=1 Tax=Aciduricibacillus chroicocephali TaxID=3054939 RepID=A0ABY9KWP0_9BACI|nr:bifunctional ornithine acetyltransferase/N-acetylglutamate synthase [Bacillaceae bacterium 44XB]